jgi:hypothetical protein
MVDVTISKLIMHIDKEISNKDLRLEPISSTCFESMLVVLDHLHKKDPSLIPIANKMHVKLSECMRDHRRNSTDITQHNLNVLQMICLSFEMNFV